MIALSIVVASCGKKGPPLPPIVRVPGAVEKFDARRIGDDIYLTLTIPSRNVDQTTPADVQHVDVYAFTGLEAPGARLMDGATLVTSIPVAAVPRDGDGRPLPATPKPGEALQGQVVTVHEALTTQTREPRPLPPPTRRRGLAPLPSIAPPPGPPRRFYVAIGYGPGHRPGPEGTTIAIPLGPLPDPPAGLVAQTLPDLVRLTWEPSGALLGFLLDRELPVELPPLELAGIGTAVAGPTAPGTAARGTGGTAASATAAEPELPPPPTRYNVFRELAPDPLVLPDGAPRGAWEANLPVPLNPVPLEGLTFDDPIQYDGRERCYHVRAVRGQAAAVSSAPTPRICVTPVDVIPPAVPTGLQANAEDGTITLLWDPNIEEDLAGYVVLRGAPGDATLNPLTNRPVPSARYVDRDVTPGTRYVYEVVAIDDRVPLGNPSAESARVEVTAP